MITITECPTIAAPCQTDVAETLMPDRQSPTLRRRRLAQRLLQLRKETGLSVADVARRLEWNPSKLSRMERNEGKRYNVRDIADLCDVYEVTDEDERDRLKQLARDGRQRGWWDPYDKMLSEETTTLFGLEAEAASVLAFESLAVPGLLQTEDYARAVFRGGPVKLPDEEIETHAEARLRRQQALLESPALQVVAVMDEAVLHRQVGSHGIMKAQLEHLRQMALMPNVVLHIIPFAVGAHAGMSSNFNILQFPEPGDLDAVFVDLVAGQMFIEEPDEVKRYHAAFLHLVGAAASPAITLGMLADR